MQGGLQTFSSANIRRKEPTGQGSARSTRFGNPNGEIAQILFPGSPFTLLSDIQ